MPAAKRQPEKKPVSHAAQPTQKAVDYKAMRQDIVAAFPKTLARLAE